MTYQIAIGYFILVLVFHNATDKIGKDSFTYTSFRERLGLTFGKLFFPEFLIYLLQLVFSSKPVFILENGEVEKLYRKSEATNEVQQELNELKRQFSNLAHIAFHYDKETYLEYKNDVDEILEEIVSFHNSLEDDFSDYIMHEIDDYEIEDFKGALMNK